MSEDQTLSYENNTETVTTAENLSEAEQESLKVGEEMEAQQEQLLAGKYKDASDLEKAYLELQGKLGEKSEEVSEETESKTETEEEAPESAANILDDIWNEGQTDKVSKETFEKLQKMDPVEVAKMAMEARSKAQQPQAREFTDQDVEQIHGLVGGPENYNNMMSWAQQNVAEQEVNMYDAVMEMGNPMAAYFAVQALALKYQDASGRDGQLLTGKAPKSTGDSFKSQAELIRAMEDDRYNDDPAYRQEVQAKLERSNVNF
tara:strand:+ start:62 stop:844 length:783 start_codon:yes stop_codon:yes gene_type:complete